MYVRATAMYGFLSASCVGRPVAADNRQARMIARRDVGSILDFGSYRSRLCCAERFQEHANGFVGAIRRIDLCVFVMMVYDSDGNGKSAEKRGYIALEDLAVFIYEYHIYSPPFSYF